VAGLEGDALKNAVAARIGGRKVLFNGSPSEQDYFAGLSADDEQLAKLVLSDIRNRDFFDDLFGKSLLMENYDRYYDRFLLTGIFNEKYGKNFEQILDSVRKLKAEHDIDQVIFDNLMVLDYDSLDNNVYVGQKKVMQALHDLAIELNIHIHIVAHPNKSGNFLRMNSISGTANITDLAQNVFILHRIVRDFESSAKEFLTKKVIKSILESDCTNVIEICKCRDKGTAIDHFIKLFYEKESNRLKDSKAENIIYNWADIDEETALVSAYDAQHPQETKPKETAETQDSYVDYSEPRQKDLPFDEAHTDDMPF
jgi:hypothetical protein